jgi:hypothetical protein
MVEKRKDEPKTEEQTAEQIREAVEEPIREAGIPTTSTTPVLPPPTLFFS